MTDTKRLLLLIFVALWCLCSLPFAHAQQCSEDLYAANTIVVKKKSVSSPAGAASFCAGTELFCADFETADMISWTATATTEDCALDGNDEWCDRYTTSPMAGSYMFGIRGAAKMCRKDFTGPTEWHMEALVKLSTVVGTEYFLGLRDAANSTDITLFTLDADPTIVLSYKNVTLTADTNFAVSADTKFYIGIHYIEESGSANNDGTIRVWVNSTGNPFTADDLKINLSGNADTGTANAGTLRLINKGDNHTTYYDNVKIESGAPSWPTS